ncbi:hypothetical protein F4779DRAFT_605753 [Xylariaceae sp. FL0662B]|nr:hypothetical protein F4779DRAFT_605753 [Xylariaceae sp. FL0662B]
MIVGITIVCVLSKVWTGRSSTPTRPSLNSCTPSSLALLAQSRGFLQDERRALEWGEYENINRMDSRRKTFELDIHLVLGYPCCL